MPNLTATIPSLNQSPALITRVFGGVQMLRLYREEKLAVRRRTGRKRALGTRAPMSAPMGPNQRWSLDFVSDAFIDGRRFRILAVVDDHTRECLAVKSQEVAHSIRTEEAEVATLWLSRERSNGHPQECRSDADRSRDSGSAGCRRGAKTHVGGHRHGREPQDRP
ncbi:putative transposase [Magnetospirillum sp. XM-1]|nr:putative transposase [Magnetospirillum sp. XM-1]